MRLLMAMADRLMGRLNYAIKILVVLAVMAVPLGYALTAYVTTQNGQIAFSTQERKGVAYLTPIVDLAAAVAAARNAAVGGAPSSPDVVDAALAAVATVDGRLGADLSTQAAFAEVTASVAAARQAVAAGAGVRDVVSGWTAAAEAVVALASAASDGSNLTLDPDLDSYYVMDAVAFRIPRLLEDVASTAAFLAVARSGGGDDLAMAASRLDAARRLGSAQSTLDAITDGLAKSYAATSSRTLTELRPVSDDTGQAVAGVIDALDAVVAAQDGAIALPDPAVAVTAVLDAWRQFLPALDELVETRVAGFTDDRRDALVITAIATLVAVYLVGGFYRTTVWPMRQLADGIGALAAGDLTRRVTVVTQDEIGRMSSTFNASSESLGRSIDAVVSAAAQVADASGRGTELAASLDGAADEVHRQVLTSVDSVSAVSERAASVATAGEQVAMSVREIAEGAAEAARTSNQALQTADGASGLVDQLSRSSEVITEITGLISAVAKQTHLLSLNAGIEAARAGEAGTSFGVVADEVRQLAEQSSRAAVDIGGQVEAIRADARAAAGAIDDIRRVISRVDEIQRVIVTAVEQQGTVTGDLDRNATELAGSAAAISASMRVAGDSARQSREQAAAVGRVAHGMGRSADSLRTAIAGFTV